MQCTLTLRIDSQIMHQVLFNSLLALNIFFPNKLILSADGEFLKCE